MLLENWDKYMSGDRGVEYFEKFWSPRTADFPVPVVEPKKDEEVAK